MNLPAPECRHETLQKESMCSDRDFPEIDHICYAAFLPAVNTTSQPGNLSRTVSQVVFTTGELGASRNFPICDLHL